MVTVAVVDDHPVVADGIRAALERATDITVGWSAHSLAEAREALRTDDSSVDVVLLDVRLPDGRGFELLPEDRARSPVFVMMSNFDRPLYAVAAFRGGAAGFLVKTASTDEIVEAVRRAAAGGLVFEARHLESVREAPTFTPRELEVVRLVAASLSNDEVGGRLGISPKTVEAYLREIFRRQGFSTRTELTLWAEREGWLEAP